MGEESSFPLDWTRMHDGPDEWAPLIMLREGLLKVAVMAEDSPGTYRLKLMSRGDDPTVLGELTVDYLTDWQPIPGAAVEARADSNSVWLR